MSKMRSIRKLLTIFFLAITIAGCSAIEPDAMGQSEELAKEPLASQSLLLQKEPKERAENKPSKPSREDRGLIRDNLRPAQSGADLQLRI